MVSLCKLSYGCNWQLAKHLISLNFTQQDVTLRYLLCFITSCLYWQLETCSINMKQLSKSTRLSSDLAACCCFSTPLKSNKHDDILFSLCWIPSLNTRVNKLCNDNKNSNDQTLSYLTQSHYWRTEKGSNLFPQTLHSSWNTACWIIFLLFNPPAISSKSMADLLTIRNSSHHQLVLDSGGVRVGM